MIKMVNRFKLTVIHFASPNLMQICACAWIYRWTKNCGKSGTRGRRGPWGFRAARPLSHSGPWAVGRWAAGLLLAKPSTSWLLLCSITLLYASVMTSPDHLLQLHIVCLSLLCFILNIFLISSVLINT